MKQDTQRTTRAFSSLLAMAAAVTLSLPAQGQNYAFGGYVWDQIDSLDLAIPLSPGNYGGAVIHSIPVGAGTGSAGFPEEPSAGFNQALSFGRLTGLGSAGTRPLNLPAGNVGTNVRSGVQLSWSALRRLPNQPGSDFILFESGTAGDPEGMMVQVHFVDTDEWSRWVYQIPASFTPFVGQPPTGDGAFVYPYDLSSFGVPELATIDGIRIANMIESDRIDGPGTLISPGIQVGQGFVLPGDGGATSFVYPDPGPLSLFPLFGSTTLDPDPLYAAILATPNSCGDGVIRYNEQCDDGNTNDKDGCSSECLLEIQNPVQKGCIAGMHRYGNQMSAAQEGLNTRCLRAGHQGDPDPQACLTLDARREVSKRRNRASQALSYTCRSLPYFGQVDIDGALDGAINLSLALGEDLFGTNLGTAVVRRSVDLQRARCQLAASRGTRDLTRTMRLEVQRCIRVGLQLNSFLTDAGLLACLATIDTDPLRNVFRSTNRLAASVTPACASVDTSVALPGVCGGSPDLLACLTARARCRTCSATNLFSDVTNNCELFDDGLSNGSCP